MAVLAFLVSQMILEPFDDFVLLAFGDFLGDLVQRKVNDVVVVDLPGRQPLAEAQPHFVNQLHFIGREVRRVRAQDVIFPSPGRSEYFQVKLRPGVRQALPGKSDLARLL